MFQLIPMIIPPTDGANSSVSTSVIVLFVLGACVTLYVGASLTVWLVEFNHISFVEFLKKQWDFVRGLKLK